ncbi:uncharacterized protein LOC114261233 [Camellia sinensis]|uniref:uncharacterized protein LOC114261233 n=1 Tax=Camellia sinensis TaxID=4442 RepID=UPI0010366C61|nr:uncharacterized protein LOC114261233 [Camellia sinensis]
MVDRALIVEQELADSERIRNQRSRNNNQPRGGGPVRNTRNHLVPAPYAGGMQQQQRQNRGNQQGGNFVNEWKGRCFRCGQQGHRRSECPQGGEYFMDQRGAQQYNRCQPGQGSKPTQNTQTNKGQPQASRNAGRPRTQPQGAGNGKKPGETNQQAVGRMYALQKEEDVDNPSVIQGMLILMNSWVKVLFDSGASHSFISTACVTSLGLAPETLGIAISVASPLGGQTRVNLVCKSCELEIFGSYLICDLRVMDMSDFDIILGMDWLSVYQAIIDCYHRTVTASSLNGTKVQFKGDRQDSLTPTCRKSGQHDQLTGWLASLILEGENREDPGLPHVVCEYADVFPDELPGLPPKRDVDFTIELQPGTSPISIAPHRMAPAEL